MIHACAIRDDGAVVCWGSNERGRLGMESSDASVGDLPGDMGDRLLVTNLGAGERSITAAARGICGPVPRGYQLLQSGHTAINTIHGGGILKPHRLSALLICPCVLVAGSRPDRHTHSLWWVTYVLHKKRRQRRVLGLKQSWAAGGGTRCRRGCVRRANGRFAHPSEPRARWCQSHLQASPYP